MKTFTLLLFTFFFLLSHQSISACVCNDYGVPTCKEFSNADVMFVGTISKITSLASEKNANKLLDSDYSLSNGQGYIGVEFNIEKSFKGTKEKTIKAYTYIGTSCELEVKKGQRWRISADKDETRSLLTFSKCRGNYHIKEPSYDTSDLEAFSKGEFNTPILGRIGKDVFYGIENANVSLTGNGLNLATVTDKYGWFKFPVTQPGKYKIKIIIPYTSALLIFKKKEITENITENETIYEYEAEVKPNSCDYEYFEIYKMNPNSIAQIFFSAVDSQGNKTSEATPKLCRLKDTETETLKNCFYIREHNEKFRGGGLAEGKYVIVVNATDTPDYDSPYPKVFYPGVRNFSEAKIIELGNRQKLDLPDFKLPEKLPTQIVTGIIILENGKPFTIDLLDNEYSKVDFTFFDPQLAPTFLSMSDEIKFSQTNEYGLSLKEDGSFSFPAFVGKKYILEISADGKNEYNYIGQIEFTVDKNLIPLVIRLKKEE